MKKFAWYTFWLYLLPIGCTRTPSEEVLRLFLPSSFTVLKNSIDELGRDKSIHITYLSSSAIARQISLGAPCHGLVLADEIWQKYLIDKKAVFPKARLLAKNSLVLVGPLAIKPVKDLALGLNLIPPGAKIIIGDPNHVPLGAYTKEALEKVQRYEKLTAQFLPAPSAQTAHIWLKQGAGEWAILYKTDPLPPTLRVIVFIDQSLHRGIEYNFLKCKNLDPLKSSFLESFLFSTTFSSLLESKGFNRR